MINSSNNTSGLFRLRDVVVFGFIIAAIFQCYYQPMSYDFSIEPLWFVETFDDASSSRSNRPRSSVSLIPPLVIDLDKDNVKDLVSIGFDNVLRVIGYSLFFRGIFVRLICW
jgi:hypothetical protein